MAAATRRYAIKIRTDFRFTSANILSIYADLEKLPPDSPKVFAQRVAIPVEYCPNPRRLPLLFHPSDLFCFGLTQDVRMFFGAPLPSEPDFTSWFTKRSRPPLHFLAETHRYTPEQYIWLNCIRRKYPNTGPDHACPHKPRHVLDSERFFWGNFMPVPLCEIGLEPLKSYKHVRSLNRLQQPDGYARWLRHSAPGAGARKLLLYLQFIAMLALYSKVLTPGIRQKIKAIGWLR